MLWAMFCYIFAALCCLLLHFCCSGCFFCACSCGCGCVCGSGCDCGCDHGCGCGLLGLVFLRIVIAWGERSERAKRASEALWCLLWVSLAYPCFRWRTLAFSCVASFARQWFACCLFFLLLYLASHASTALKRFRSYCCMLPLLSYVFALPVPC